MYRIIIQCVFTHIISVGLLRVGRTVLIVNVIIIAAYDWEYPTICMHALQISIVWHG